MRKRYRTRHPFLRFNSFLQNQTHRLENIRVAQLTLRVKLSWSIFLWSMVGHKWARHTKSQQCLTTQAVLHPVDHLIKPIMALHLHVLCHGRVQAILSVFRSMKLDVNLHFWASYSNVTHCNEWEAIVESEAILLGVWAWGQFVIWLDLSPSQWTKGIQTLKDFLEVLKLWFLNGLFCIFDVNWPVAEKKYLGFYDNNNNDNDVKNK